MVNQCEWLWLLFKILLFSLSHYFFFIVTFSPLLSSSAQFIFFYLPHQLSPLLSSPFLSSPLLSSPCHTNCLTSLISFLLSFPLQYHLKSLLLPPSLSPSLPIYNSIPLVQSFPYFNWILATLERLERDFRVCMELVGMSSSRDIKQIAFWSDCCENKEKTGMIKEREKKRERLKGRERDYWQFWWLLYLMSLSSCDTKTRNIDVGIV